MPPLAALSWSTYVFGGAGLLFLLILLLRPRWLFRAFFWVLCHTVYRLRVLRRLNLPDKGGALLVCNHVSHLDFLFLLASTRRHIHFVIFAGWTKVWGLRWLLKWAGVIPIDKSSGPRAIVTSLKNAAEYLRRGELVCIFAEGRFTRTGFLLPFNRGMEQILKHCPAPIVPVCLAQVWGSIFSYRGGKLIWKLPQRLPYRVTVAFGDPLPATTTAPEVRQAVQKLEAECALRRSRNLLPVHRRFVRQASRRPWRTCVSDGQTGESLSYGQTLRRAICLSRQLRKSFADDEAMVGVWLPPGIQGVLANLALAFRGKVAVNLDWAASSQDVESAIRQCGLRSVLTTAAFTVSTPLPVGSALQQTDVQELAGQVSRWQKVRAWLNLWLWPRVLLDRWVLRLGRHTAEDLATVAFTSVAGEPKGVMLKHANVAGNVESLIQTIATQPGDRVLGLFPLHDCLGYTVTFWAPLQIGASAVFHSDPRRVEDLGRLCRERRCTILIATPEILRGLVEKVDAADLATLRFVWSVREKLPPELATAFEAKFGLPLLVGYGRPELSPAAVINVPDVDIDGFKQVGLKPGSIGQALPGVAAQIVDAENGAPVPPERAGVLQLYGPNVMAGYLGQPELTAQAIRDGWYVTGEKATMDSDGFITLESGPAAAEPEGKAAASERDP